MKDKKWTELIKLIVEELAKEPFKLDFNVSSFASLNDSPLLGILHRVLCEIDLKYDEDCQNDPTFVNGQLNIPRVMEMLRVLRYWTATTDDPDLTNEALLIPVHETVWEIMGWLLLKKQELTERAYLGHFLVKVHIPEEMLLDERMAPCLEQYKKQMELFKETHKSLKDMKRKMERRPVDELVNDLRRIRHDIECLSRKVDSVKSKVLGDPTCGNAAPDFAQKEERLFQAQMIRKERDTKIGIRRQFEEEQNKLADLARKQEMLSVQLNDLVKLNEDGNPETALNRLEQDSEILKHIVEEKLPRQIVNAKRKYLAFRITEENPPLCSADLEFRKQRMEEVLQEIQFLNNCIPSRRNLAGDTGPVLNYARDQLIRSRQKKLDLAEKLRSMEEGNLLDALKLLEINRAKHEMVCGSGDSLDNNRILRPQEYKTYVRAMRNKATSYKEMKSNLQSLQAELGNLSVTKYILEGELKHSEDELRSVEEKLGFEGLCEHHSEGSQVDVNKLEGINNKTIMARELNSQLCDSKSRWQDILTHVTEKRKELSLVRNELGNAQEKMALAVGPLKHKIVELEKCVSQSQQKYESDQLELAKMAAEIPVIKTEMARATGVSGHGPYARNNLDRVRGKLVESDRIHQMLKMEVDQLDGTQQYEIRQKQIWSDLTTLLQAKAALQGGKRQQSADSFSKQPYDS